MEVDSEIRQSYGEAGESGSNEHPTHEVAGIPDYLEKGSEGASQKGDASRKGVSEFCEKKREKQEEGGTTNEFWD